jgi:hypothetical protein
MSPTRATTYRRNRPPEGTSRLLARLETRPLRHYAVPWLCPVGGDPELHVAACARRQIHRGQQPDTGAHCVLERMRTAVEVSPTVDPVRATGRAWQVTVAEPTPESTSAPVVEDEDQ